MCGGGWMDGWMGWDWMVIIVQRHSKSTCGANKGVMILPEGIFIHILGLARVLLVGHGTQGEWGFGMHLVYSEIPQIFK